MIDSLASGQPAAQLAPEYQKTGARTVEMGKRQTGQIRPQGLAVAAGLRFADVLTAA
jgi:hypothetical protein